MSEYPNYAEIIENTKAIKSALQINCENDAVIDFLDYVIVGYTNMIQETAEIVEYFRKMQIDTIAVGKLIPAPLAEVKRDNLNDMLYIRVETSDSEVYVSFIVNLAEKSVDLTICYDFRGIVRRVKCKELRGVY